MATAKKPAAKKPAAKKEPKSTEYDVIWSNLTYHITVKRNPQGNLQLFAPAGIDVELHASK